MEQNNDEKKKMIQSGIKMAMGALTAPIRSAIWAAVAAVLPYILIGAVIFVVILCVYFGTLEQIDQVYDASGDWGERMGNAVSLYGFRTNEELDEDEEGKFFKMLDLYKELFGFDNYEVSILSQTLLYEGSNEERIYLSETANPDEEQLFDVEGEGSFSFWNFIKNIMTNYQRGFLAGYGGQSQYLKANKNMLVNATALRKCSLLTGGDNDKEAQCYRGYLVAEYNIVTDYAIDCNYGEGAIPCDNNLIEPIESDVEVGYLVLHNNIFGEGAAFANEVLDLKSTMQNWLTKFTTVGPIIEQLNEFVDNTRDEITLLLMGTLADEDTHHFYYDGYIVNNLKEEYKLKKEETYDNESETFDGLIELYDKERIEKERKNRRETSNSIMDLVETYFDLTYGSNYKRKNKVVGSFSEKNYMINLNINGQNTSVSFDDYVTMLLLDKYGTDVFDFDRSMLEAAIIEARTNAYSGMNSTTGSTNFEVDGDFTGIYELYKDLSSEQRSKLVKALANTTGKVIKDENGNLNNNFELNTNGGGSSADEIIGNQGGNVDVKDKYASPFPTIGSLSQFLSSGYGDIDSAHITDHGGVDIALGAGTNIYSASGGTVVASYNSCGVGYLGSTCGPSNRIDGWGFSGYGNVVVVQSFDDKGIPFYTYYAHMAGDSINLNVGDQVTTGQYIGQIGSSGSSTGPHLHFEVRYGSNDKSKRENPLEFYGI